MDSQLWFLFTLPFLNLIDWLLGFSEISSLKSTAAWEFLLSVKALPSVMEKSLRIPTEQSDPSYQQCFISQAPELLCWIFCIGTAVLFLEEQLPCSSKAEEWRPGSAWTWLYLLLWLFSADVLLWCCSRSYCYKRKKPLWVIEVHFYHSGK